MGLVAARWTVVVVGSLFVVGAVAGYIGSRLLRVKSLEAHFPHLPDGLIGLRIVQVSDLHVGPHTSTRFLARVSKAVTAAAPDLLVITGDQVDDYAEDVSHFAAAFTGLRAPLGVFAVAGNHDVYAGWAEVHRGMNADGHSGSRQRGRAVVVSVVCRSGWEAQGILQASADRLVRIAPSHQTSPERSAASPRVRSRSSSPTTRHCGRASPNAVFT